MLKRLTSVAVMLALLFTSLALAGCEGKKEISEQNDNSSQQAVESAISNEVDESVEQSTTEPEDPFAEPEDVPSKATLDADGYYSWQVGNYTLRTRINVYDYIDESSGKWNANDMALAIGWDDWADHLGGNNNEGFKGNDLLLKLAHSSGACNGVNVFGTSAGTIGAICSINTASYSMNDTSFSVSIEYIVITAYAMENFSSPSADPFASVAPSIGGYYRFDQ